MACFETRKEIWDKVAKDLLENGGVATVDLTPSLARRHESNFNIAKYALNHAHAVTKCLTKEVDEQSKKLDISFPIIDANANAAHATGYHAAGSSGSSLSRYNAFREGFIFSNGNFFDVQFNSTDGMRFGQEGMPTEETENSTRGTFREAMEDMFSSMHDEIGDNILKAISRELGLEDENWFQNVLGPTHHSSQWHIKRFTPYSGSEIMNTSNNYVKSNIATSLSKSKINRSGNVSKIELLPVHTDPSLISVVLHDAPGKRHGAMGLEHHSLVSSDENKFDNVSSKKEYKWVELESHGHYVATIFCGSVISYITGGHFPSAKHRVVSSSLSSKHTERIAATLFIRPHLDAALAVPPSNKIDSPKIKVNPNFKFRNWLLQVSRNYMKAEKRKVDKERCNETKS
mmetsp:Transcript_19304/g.27155  ORF Transcript_19304/g.27155 Transcript_19304/m.27155 type:complete len:402 (+) Transcript_19304:153-1358(+)|eukprot:CAMPEP_0184869278 /NCGR_PEP_ID=MMETSP0580-20130426/33494_1 /TAXON_ID=1118495 /ORGANISM="Dactyliosolen fragilissimus" /LENGTH=401 /DNA_ID=CAMNT_0027370653 /DNA_START=66 /DNA_END=1271 /DNA_ORIENTATION=+